MLQVWKDGQGRAWFSDREKEGAADRQHFLPAGWEMGGWGGRVGRNRCLSREEGVDGCWEESGMRLSASEAEQVGAGLRTSHLRCSQLGLRIT